MPDPSTPSSAVASAPLASTLGATRRSSPSCAASTVESVHHGVGRGRRSRRAPALRRRRPRLLTFTRSALKPLQALPFVAAGGVRALRLDHARRPRCCARAIPASRGTSKPPPSMLAKAGNAADDLQCGTHAPGYYERAARSRRRRRIRRSRTTARASTAACSRTASHAATPKDDYLALDHPLQQEIRRAVAQFTGDAGSSARRRNRRLLGAELCDAARAACARLRPAGGRGRRRRLRTRAAACWPTR